MLELAVHGGPVHLRARSTDGRRREEVALLQPGADAFEWSLEPERR